MGLYRQRATGSDFCSDPGSLPTAKSMFIPRYWAEAPSKAQTKGRTTVRRYGWSATSQADAQAMAEVRLAEALRDLSAGEKRVRMEPKVAYNGSEGFPIREEIVSEHGDLMVTRNSYGALCLNTPDALFADVDLPEGPSDRTGCLMFLALPTLLLGIGGTAGLIQGRLLGGFPSIVMLVVGLGLLMRIGWEMLGRRLWLRRRGRADAVAMRRIRGFLDTHPDWRLRIYRTPAGYRVLATHRPFSPMEPEVSAFFDALGTDPVYVRMCRNQQCFRARVSPKPWRIGVGHLRPRSGVWPIGPEGLRLRQEWVAAYEAKSAGHAACSFLVELGLGAPHGKILAVQQLHDRLSRAEAGLPIA